MPHFADTYLGRLRQSVGRRLLLVPGARIIIEDDEGRILLQERTDFKLWGLPGGNAEVGEDITSIIEREVKEEVCLDVFRPKVFGVASNPVHETITFPNGDRCQFFVTLFFTRSFSGLAKSNDDETLSVGWFSPATLPAMLANMQYTVEAYSRFKLTGEFQMI